MAGAEPSIGRIGYARAAVISDTRCKIIPSGWAGPLARWLATLAAAGRSQQTIQLRRAHVAQLARAVVVAPDEVGVDDMTAYLAARRWSVETRRAHRASLRGWWTWYARPELAAALPMVRPSVPRPRPTPDHVLRVGMAAASRRQQIILRLAAEAGLRRGEIAGVHARDLDADLLGPTLTVTGKGGRPRTVPISADLAAAIRMACEGGWLLPGRIDGHLSPRRVGELATEALPDGWTLHTLRHRYASRAYAASHDVVAVSRLLGHASVTTTQRYVATDAARLREVALAAA